MKRCKECGEPFTEDLSERWVEHDFRDDHDGWCNDGCMQEDLGLW